MVVFWEPGIVAKAEEHAFHLILNGFNAFALNIAVAVVPQQASRKNTPLLGFSSRQTIFSALR